MTTPFRSLRPVAAVTSVGLALGALAIGPAASAQAAVHGTALISGGTGAKAANNSSFTPSASADGRYVAFVSEASNLVPKDTNRKADVFLRDTETGKISRISVSTKGKQGNENSYNPSISDDGRFIVFDSFASNLVMGDLNRKGDAFLHDRQDGSTVRVSKGFDGKEADGQSGYATISGDGMHIEFESLATNILPNQADYPADIYVMNRVTGAVEWISKPLLGAQATGSSGNATISRTGRFVAFTSSADNILPGDYNKRDDIFVRDRQTGTTQRVTTTNIGQETNANSDFPSISDDGRFVAFESVASNIVSTDFLQLDHAKLLPRGTNPLIEGDTNYESDVFVKDMQTGLSELISRSSAGVQGTQGSYGAAISGDGSKVAFTSSAENLVGDDTNRKREIFLHELASKKTTRMSVSSDGKQGNELSATPAISRDGSKVVFVSDSSNLVAGDRNREGDVFVRH